MYIKSLIYEDQSTNWKLELIEFKPLTLLVGVSGVGKTQILKALLNVKKISHGHSLNGLKWEIEFKTTKGQDCKWCGAFENKGIILEFIYDIDDEYKKYKPYIEYEQLFIDDTQVIQRDKIDITFNGNKTVKLSPQESIISLLREEEQIKNIYNDFYKIIFDNNTDQEKFRTPSYIDETDLKQKTYKNLNSIRNSDEDIKTKLCLLYRNEKTLFKDIVGAFIDIFPIIDDVRIVEDSVDIYIHQSIEIKEKNLNWIHEPKISSGMFRILILISELYLCADDTVILIDEFENSLGINCINQITHSILASERNLQFIITSHHPYIINDIGFSHWKIVTRKGGVVTAIDAEKLGIGRSKHQAFTQLANLTAYSEGIES